MTGNKQIGVNSGLATSFATLLRSLRTSAGFSQEQLAERARMSVAAISALERGVRRAPYRTSVDLIADGLGLDADARRALHEAAAAKTPRNTFQSESSRHGRLPLPTTRLYGRAKDVARVVDALSSRRLVTVVGPGGVGKTRLAVEAAAYRADDVQHDVWFVDLSGARSGDAVSITVAIGLGINVQSASSTIDEIASFLEARTGLVVLDNCEQSLSGAASLVTALLRRCAHLTVLATSREPLGADGELVIVLDTLDVGGSPDVEDGSLPAAAQLFVERANDAGTRLDAVAQRNDVLRICRRLDGLPLAIELAAPRTRSLSLPDLISALDSRFALLADRSESRAPRHRNLRAMLDWSFDLLTDEERAVFQRLSVFPAGWTLAGASVVAAGDGISASTVRAIHGVLVDRSLIKPAQLDGTYRYAYLETVREYARERAVSGADQRMAQANFVSYAVSVAEECARAYGTLDEGPAVEKIDIEYPTLRAAVLLAAEPAFEPIQAHRLVHALSDYWLMRGATSEALSLTRRVLDGCGDDVPLDHAVRTQIEAARFHRINGEFSTATRLDGSALERARSSGDPALIAAALTGHAADQFAAGFFEDAYTSYTEEIALVRSYGDDALLARTLHCLGGVATILKRYEEAETFLSESVRLLTRIGDRRGLAWAEFRRGFRALMMSDLETAERHYRSSLRLRRAIGDRYGTVSCLQAIGIIAAARRSYVEAAGAFGECLEMSREYRFAARVIEAAQRIADLAHRIGETARGIDVFIYATRLREAIGWPIEPNDLADMAELARAADIARAERDVDTEVDGRPTLDALADAATRLLHALDWADAMSIGERRLASEISGRASEAPRPRSARP